MRPYLPLILACLVTGTAMAAPPSTSNGRVSVAQLFDLSQRATTDSTAHSTLVAYLFAIGETVGVLADEAEQRGLQLGCQRSFTLSQEAAMNALRAAAPDPSVWADMEATPVIVADIFARAGCD